MLGIGLILLASGAAAVAEPPAMISADLLRTQPILSLKERLLGEPAPEMVEGIVTWAPAPMGGSGAVVLFAPRAEATNWSGLCSVDLRSVLLSPIEPGAATTDLGFGPAGRIRAYTLLSADPPRLGHDPADGARCGALHGFLDRLPWRLTSISTLAGSADPDQAAFAYRAFAAASHMTAVDDSACSVEVDSRCRDVGHFLSAFDLRDLRSLQIGHCLNGAENCVAAFFASPGREEGLTVQIELSGNGGDAPGAPVQIRSVRVVTLRDEAG